MKIIIEFVLRRLRADSGQGGGTGGTEEQSCSCINRYDGKREREREIFIFFLSRQPLTIVHLVFGKKILQFFTFIFPSNFTEIKTFIISREIST